MSGATGSTSNGTNNSSTKLCHIPIQGLLHTPSIDMELSIEQTLIHFVENRQLPGDQVLGCLEWKDAVRLAASCSLLWPHVERMVAKAKPDKEVAFHISTPDKLRIPMLTGLTSADIRMDNN